MTEHEISQYKADIVDFVLSTPFGDRLSYNDISRAFQINDGHVKAIVADLDDPERRAVSRFISD